MFDMESIGRRISEFRKRMNMTQLELADTMNISFQAVSNWERGISMPDISKLPELAELFGVGIDELLGKKSELIESAAEGDIKEYLETNEVSVDELCEAAPLLKPNQVDETFKEVEVKNIGEIFNLLPFLDQSIIDELAEKESEKDNCDGLAMLAPFTSQEIIDSIAKKLSERGISISKIAPFMSSNCIDESAAFLYEESGLSAVKALAPFMSEEGLEKIANMEYQERGISSIVSIAPFLRGEYIDELAQEAISKDGIKAISSIAPFISRDVLSKYVREKYL